MKNFLMVLHYNAITFLIIHRMWKAFIVVYQAVNDTSGSARELQDSIKTYEIFNLGSEISMENFSSNFPEKALGYSINAQTSSSNDSSITT